MQKIKNNVACISIEKTSKRIGKERSNYLSFLQECMDIAEERGKQYGTVKTNLQETANIYEAMFGETIEPEKIVQVMIAVKWGRNRHKKKKDNLLDSINYTAILASYL